MVKGDLDLKKIESKWKNYWEKEKIYRFNSKSKKKIYSIDTPPPYISGRMHIGHAFSYSQQDFIVRFRRMFHGNVFYPFGTDDNGLPTERFIEKINKVKSKDMSRGEFINLCLKTLKKVTPECIEDFKVLGISADYDIYYSTIDDHSRKISQKSFVDLYKKGLIYKDKLPMHWCTECQTTIAQAELEDKEMPGLFLTLRFEVDGKELPIATTRPELLPACVAVFINPKDERYKHLKGKKAKVPLFDFEVPVLEDASAEIEKGTGVLMVCSYGDKFDVDAINRFGLEPRIIFTQDGRLNELTGKYRLLEIKKAREEIYEDLNKAGLIIKEDKISHVVNVHDKCGTEIEFLPTDQWFIRVLDKKKELIQQGKEIKWYPEFMRKRYENWIKGLEWDWNISRDRHFGVPMPVWECKKCNEIILPKDSELPVDPLKLNKKCPKCKGYAIGEMKVLDTWATSSLTPQLALGLIKNKLKIPMSLRPQAHDIIRTWAFYTITRAYLEKKKLPWKNIMISGFVTLGKEKMSKSKGNVIAPQQVMEEYGADALRYWAASSKLGEDLPYQEKEVRAGKRTIIKLLNASRFVFMNLKEKPKKPRKLVETDRDFLVELERSIYLATLHFKDYEYSRAKFDVEDFFWKFFCNIYLETVKGRLYNGNKEEKESASYTLYTSLLAILKMMAPIMPFITEEIYQTYYRKYEKDKSIHISEWPKYDKDWIEKWDDKKVSFHANKLTLFSDLLTQIRTEKTKAKKSMNAECVITLNKMHYEDLGEKINDLKNVTNAVSIKQGDFKVEFK